ncbi:hypothetical protein QAD02_016877 [Eretmocerus hayati]|uniref:Uncharacterized protein n=1 Tax=Eretmocerus hayati TaxID=131215 RepID=A0ACC2PH54_9HYME|nr:hypothetical protein QAD02_016877 [Eretmocerus hayati]
MWATPWLTLIIQVSTTYSFCNYGKESDWSNSIIYQIYPRSFKDSDNDGIGDLRGITSKLEHIVDIGADTLYLSPIYPSPMKDFGYDVLNYTDIAEEYGTLDDFDDLAARAKELGLRIVLDFVPNHSSDEHEWFRKSIERIPPYDNYYIWQDAKHDSNGERIPPNNWMSFFGGSAWEWNEKRQQYYYHMYLASQPDLNYRSPHVKQEIEDILKFWMERGVDGFRVDSADLLLEDDQLRDEIEEDDTIDDRYWHIKHDYTRDLNQTHDIIGSWRAVLDDFESHYNSSRKLMILEAYVEVPRAMLFYGLGGNPFNFKLLFKVDNNSNASKFKNVIDSWLKAIPNGEIPNWIVGNHDNHRIASRFGRDGNRADLMSMVAMMLPGIVMTYYGDEIGMIDRPFSYEEILDPYGCQAGPEEYHLVARDYERTPFQWDGSVSAGFSNTTNTWLPLHENYKQLNLELQKMSEISHYKVYQALTRLKKSSPVLRCGTTELFATEYVLSIVREIKGQRPVVLLINFSTMPIKIDARSWLDIPDEMEVYIGSVPSGLKSGHKMDMSDLELLGGVSVIFI